MVDGSAHNQVRVDSVDHDQTSARACISKLFVHGMLCRIDVCMQGRFLPYLPQDNAGLAGVQAEMACELINDELAQLLSRPASEIWDTVASDSSLITCLDTYLRFARYALHIPPCRCTAVQLHHCLTACSCRRPFDGHAPILSDTDRQLSHRIFAVYHCL